MRTTQFVLVTLTGQSQHQSQLQPSGWLVSGNTEFNDDFLESPFSLLSLEFPELHHLPGPRPLAWSLDGGGELRTGPAACVTELGALRLFSLLLQLSRKTPLANQLSLLVGLISPQHL